MDVADVETWLESVNEHLAHPLLKVIWHNLQSLKIQPCLTAREESFQTCPKREDRNANVRKKRSAQHADLGACSSPHTERAPCAGYRPAAERH